MKICGLMKTTLLDYPGRIACTIFTGGCNFRCPFCHNADLVDPDKITEKYTDIEIAKFLKSRSDILQGIAITGGEPTIWYDLTTFIDKIKKFSNDLDVKLDTNGSNPDALNWLIKNGYVQYVAMDIKSGYTSYEKTIGTNIFLIFHKIRKSIEILLNSDIPFEFRTTVVHGIHTEKDFEEISSMIQGYKYTYYLQRYVDNGSVLCKDNKFSSPSDEELNRYAEILKSTVKNVEIRG